MVRIPVCGVVACLAIFGSAALAQGQANGNTEPVPQSQSGIASSSTAFRGPVIRGSLGFSAEPAFHGSPVTGAPYSGQRVSEHVQIGSDGTRFTTINQQDTIYRDSNGRSRTERAVMLGANAPADAPVIVEIQDPVAGVSFTLDTQNKVAHRAVWKESPAQQPGVSGYAVARSGQWFSSIGGTAPVPPPPARMLANGAAMPVPSSVTTGPSSGHPRPEAVTEDLGQQVIEGVLAQGRRTTQTWPTGSAGNDRPFQTVSETWYSPELKESILTRTNDPRSGESTMKLIRIDRSEPPASLFQPPAEYSVTDETGPFQIQWTGAKQ